MTAVEETYCDVEKLIHKLTWSHVRKYGRDYDEALSDAHLGFMAAYKKFDGRRSQFITLCYWYVRGYLLNGMNRPQGCSIKAKIEFDRSIRHSTDSLVVVADDISFDVEKLMSELSEDARVVIRLVLDLPRVQTPSKLKRSVFQHLQRMLGWTAARCIETFREVMEAL